MSSQEQVDFVVDRSDLRRCQFLHAPLAGELAAGSVQMRVDQFAFTANNVTYAVAGDMLAYWNFFPAAAGWGRVPVWGFADVLRSRHSGVEEGTRIFGYLPMSTHLTVQPEAVRSGGFVDGAPHRAGRPAIYNQYTLVTHDPGYSPDREAQHALFRPLFTTAFLLDDFLADNAFFGARCVILSSASSKTAFGLAFLLAQRKQVEVVGLTSKSNADFVGKLGCYDRVVTYDQIASLPKQPAAFVDMAGDGEVVRTLHQHYGDDMKHSCIVGVTHWERREPPQELPGATPTFFFAPTQLEKRMQEWGGAGFQQRYGEAWQRFLAFSANAIHVVSERGTAAVERVYLAMLEGRARPDEGHILSLWA
jgi:hypothetical protein